jgi:hypothetical protein
MGNRKYTLTWQWPLICLEWIPEVLASYDSIIEPSWAGLQRVMTAHVANQSFGIRIFSQLKCFLTDTRLVEQYGTHIRFTIDPKREYVKLHLKMIFDESHDEWADYFRDVYEHRRVITYEDIKSEIPAWSDVTSYPVFKQWSQYFQFIDLGLLLPDNLFLPISALSNYEYRDYRFIERCLKAVSGDPRHLTGRFSFHSESDSLSWTKGESHIPLSYDSNIDPRFPYELIVTECEDDEAISSDWILRVRSAQEYWDAAITKKLNDVGITDLDELIIHWKYLLDYFLFGNFHFNGDNLDRNTLDSVKRLWQSVRSFRMVDGHWSILPNLFRDITRLYWGVSFFRNSLTRPLPIISDLNTQIFHLDAKLLKSIPIKCHKSRRSLYAIQSAIMFIYKALSPLIDNDVGKSYEDGAKATYDEVMSYIINSDSLDRRELVEELESLVSLQPEKIYSLSYISQIDFPSFRANNSVMKLCYWVHRHRQVVENTHVKNVVEVRTRLNIMEDQLRKELNVLDKNLDLCMLNITDVKEWLLSLKAVIK